ncbi:unnamed protein product [Oikopleura dioica]|uniref:Uncharacterized protein n=1 Tax=Oikopleura dioica TaxID=34765 RepID=E4Y4M3_OIKDI|nr:unnamed protein product [Oikopleura dioica]
MILVTFCRDGDPLTPLSWLRLSLAPLASAFLNIVLMMGLSRKISNKFALRGCKKLYLIV